MEIGEYGMKPYLLHLKNKLALFSCLFLVICSPASANYVQSIFFDTDHSTLTGCSFDFGTPQQSQINTGYEAYVKFTIGLPGSTNEYLVTGQLIQCTEGQWQSPSPLTNEGWTVSLQAKDDHDVIEGFIPVNVLGTIDNYRARVVAVTSGISGEVDTIGLDGNQIIFQSLATNVPSMTFWGLLILGALLFIFGCRYTPTRNAFYGFVFASIGLSSMYVLDVAGSASSACSVLGFCFDWQTEQPVASDAVNDVTDPAIDIVNLYMRDTNLGSVMIGIELNDVSNQCVSLSPCNNNAECSQSSSTSNATCVCNVGFSGDGYNQCDAVYPPSNSNCIDSSCSCEPGYSGNVYWEPNAFIYIGSCILVQEPENSSCDAGVCSCDSGYVGENSSGPPVWNEILQAYIGSCVIQVSAIYNQAIFDDPTYLFQTETSSGNFGVMTWQ